MVNNLKELFPDYVVLLKLGTFYETYNDDAKIISYLFRYKIKTLSSDDKVCGFPIVSINKVTYLLEKKNINYIMIDKSHNYEEENKMNYKKKNTYKDILDTSSKYIDKLNRIDKIKNYLLKDDSKLEQVERILYER
jgi:DNA mismatch repair ATPase MutS